MRVGPLELDPVRRQVRCNGDPLDLTPREYELLKTMLAHRGRLLTKGRLLRAVWGTAYDAEAHYLHVYVSRVRRKLDRRTRAAGRAASSSRSPASATGSGPATTTRGDAR